MLTCQRPAPRGRQSESRLVRSQVRFTRDNTLTTPNMARGMARTASVQLGRRFRKCKGSRSSHSPTPSLKCAPYLSAQYNTIGSTQALAKRPPSCARTGAPFLSGEALTVIVNKLGMILTMYSGSSFFQRRYQRVYNRVVFTVPP